MYAPDMVIKTHSSPRKNSAVNKRFSFVNEDDNRPPYSSDSLTTLSADRFAVDLKVKCFKAEATPGEVSYLAPARTATVIDDVGAPSSLAATGMLSACWVVKARRGRAATEDRSKEEEARLGTAAKDLARDMAFDRSKTGM